MTLESLFSGYVGGFVFGAGVITAAVLARLIFHVGLCG